MSMRRFFHAHRDEDHSQIQYLTAKCTRLAHDKAVLDREFLVSRDRERKLQNALEATTTRLLHQEQLNMELRMKHDQLISRIHQQQDLVDLLQQRVVLLAGESFRDGELLRQVGSEMLCLQSSEVKLEGLVEQLHAEAQHRAVVADSLQAELRSKTVELKELQETNKTLTVELKDLRTAHQKKLGANSSRNNAAQHHPAASSSKQKQWINTVHAFLRLVKVRELQQENEGSLGKLQETAEQFEWLCQQQRYWMSCVKRFKDCLMKEREALRVLMLEKNAEKPRKSLHDDCPTQGVLCPLQDSKCCDRQGALSTDTKNLLEDRSLEPGLVFFFSSHLLQTRK